MNCTQLHELIHNFVDGALTGKRLDSAKNHIENCDGCAGEVLALRSVDTALREMTLEPAPEGFADHVVSMLHATGRIAAPSHSVSGIRSWQGPRVALAGVIIVLLAVAIFPATVGSLKGLVVKGTVLVTDAYLAVEKTVAGADVVRGVLSSLQADLGTLKTVLMAGFSLLARAGELFLLPALLTIMLLALGVLLYLRTGNRRSAEHATFSF